MTKVINFSDMDIEAEFDDALFEQQKKDSGFPLHILPEHAQELINQAEQRGLNPDLLAASMLGAVSGALGSNFTLTTDDQKPALWIALVAPSGTGKTPILNLAVKPLRDHDSYLRGQQAIPLSTITGASPKKGEPQYQKALIMSDFTPEVLGIMQNIRPRGICIVVNELAQFFNQFGRYNQRSGDSQIYMNAWDANSPVSYDRVKGNLLIKSPYLPILGTIQPSEARQIFEGGRDLNGFTHRMLFVYLPDLERESRITSPIPSTCIEAWHKAISRLLHLDDNSEFTMDLSAEASSIYTEFINGQNRDLVNGTREDRLRGLHSKFDLHALRLATVIHAMRWAYQTEEQFPTQIEADTMKEAIVVAEFFRSNALQMIEDGIGNTSNPAAVNKKMELNARLSQEFTTKEAQEAGKQLGISTRTVESYLADKQLFVQTSRGNYKKVPNHE
jgi:hypothetical protein